LNEYKSTREHFGQPRCHIIHLAECIIPDAVTFDANTVPVNVGFEENTDEPVPVVFDVPVPPKAVARSPDETFVEFKVVRPDPLPVMIPDALTFDALTVPVNVGFEENTTEPVPDTFDVPVPPKAVARSPDETFVEFKVVRPDPSPVMIPDALTFVAFIVPVNIGLSLNTLDPVPVTFDVPVPPKAVARSPDETFVEFKVVRPDPSPVMIPDDVTFVANTVPVNVGFVENTTEPVPVVLDVPVPP
jgi:hypothetical protein